MENPNPNSASNASATTKRIFRTNSNKNSRSISMSDTESQVSFYSPYPFDSPMKSDDPVFDSNSMTIVPASKFLPKKKKGSSQNLSYPATPPVPPPPPAMFGWAMNEGLPLGMENVGGVEEEVQGGGGGERRSRAAAGYALRRPERMVMVKKVALVLRICQVFLCLISFCVMGSDKTRGWSGDSFYRYREYRYLVGVNIIGFLHSGFQVCDITYCLVSGNHVISHYLRYYSDFMIDQTLAYLLMSASSAGATRLLDWISNWGKDAFTEMATASIWTSFLAFFAFAFSSLICGYTICCCRDSA